MGIACLLGIAAGSMGLARAEDRVAYAMPGGEEARARVEAAAGWLVRHLRRAELRGVGPVEVVAWKDPTLNPGVREELAGYLITDTLWASRALRALEPGVAAGIEAGLERVGWSGNGLHEVLFRPVGRLLHAPDDEDYVHGHSLGVYAAGGGVGVDVRVFRQRWDARFAEGHPVLFAEHAVFRALEDHWAGRGEEARAGLRAAMRDDRGTDAGDRIWWDAESGIVVDRVNIEEWDEFRRGGRATCRHYTFKLALLMYAIRVVGLEGEYAAELEGMRARLWGAQHADGGLAHFVDVRRGGVAEAAPDATGEATALAILVETVRVR
jgi:hypothetical protein